MVITCASAAHAEDLELGGTLQFDSVYEEDGGFQHAENTVQLSLKGEFRGAELELEVESLEDSDPDAAEITLTLGYGGDLRDGLGWSASYSRSYLDVSGWDEQELALGLSAELGDGAVGEIKATHDLEEHTNEIELGLELEPSDTLAFGVVVGHSQADDGLFGEFGVTYSVTDAVAFEALYERAADESGKLTLSAIWSFSLTGD